MAWSHAHLIFLVMKQEKTIVINHDYLLWQKKDQYLLDWFTATLSETILSSIYGLNIFRQVWTSLAERFASQPPSRVAYLKRQL